MEQINPSEADDFSDLGFDIAPHREALTSFARLNLGHVSIRPALRARDLLLVRSPSSRFAVGVTNDPRDQEQAEAGRGGLAFEVIHEAGGSTEASQVRADVERYFLRHFPGRVLARPVEGPADGVFVYVTCRAPDA